MNVTATSFQISWHPPNFDGYSPIRNYTLAIFDPFNQMISVGNSCRTNSSYTGCIVFITSIFAHDLAPYTLYNITINVNNDVGTSLGRKTWIITDQTGTITTKNFFKIYIHFLICTVA